MQVALRTTVLFSMFLPASAQITASIKETVFIELAGFRVLPMITCDASTSVMKLEAYNCERLFPLLAWVKCKSSMAHRLLKDYSLFENTPPSSMALLWFIPLSLYTEFIFPSFFSVKPETRAQTEGERCMVFAYFSRAEALSHTICSSSALFIG